MRRITPLIVISALVGAGAAMAQTAFAPAAIVNDDPITYYEIEQRAILLALGGSNDRPDEEMSNVALEQLIDDRLRAQAASRVQLTASPDEISAAAEELAQRQGTNRDGLVERIRRVGVSEDTLIDLLRPQIVWRELVNARFGGRATPSEPELDQEIALAAAGETRAFRVSEIAIPIPPGRESQAQQLIQRVQRELQNGADFSATARRYSRSPSASNGGDVGWIPETAVPANIADALAALEPGDISQPVEVPGGVSIFRLTETRTERPPWAQPAQVSLVRVMVPVEDEGDEAVDVARAKAKDIAGASNGCEGLPDIGGAATERTGLTLINELPGSVEAAVRLLLPGQASRPIKTDDSMDVFILCERQGGADETARAQLRDQIRNTRLARFAEGYMQELRRDAVIERR
ncbi:MAG: peptidylprolyl isomerase [Pseudomonadota bacterium]